MGRRSSTSSSTNVIITRWLSKMKPKVIISRPQTKKSAPARRCVLCQTVVSERVQGVRMPRKKLLLILGRMWPRNTKSRPTRTVTVLGTLIFPGEKASDTMMPTMTSKKSSSSSTKES